MEELGFFRHVPSEELGSARQGLAGPQSFFEAFDAIQPGGGATRRVYDADPEDLATFGVRDLFGRIAPFLRHEGVDIEVAYGEVRVPASGSLPPTVGAARLDEGGWLDEAGPRPVVESMRVAMSPGAGLVTVTEAQHDARSVLIVGDKEVLISDGRREADVRLSAVCAVLHFLDALFIAHGSAERAYAVYFGTNDGLILLATPAMARALDADAAPERAGLRDASGDYIRSGDVRDKAGPTGVSATVQPASNAPRVPAPVPVTVARSVPPGLAPARFTVPGTARCSRTIRVDAPRPTVLEALQRSFLEGLAFPALTGSTEELFRPSDALAPSPRGRPFAWSRARVAPMWRSTSRVLRALRSRLGRR